MGSLELIATIYLMICFLVLILSFLIATDYYICIERRKIAARITISFVLWPLWGIAGLIYILYKTNVTLWRLAFPHKEK